MAQAWKRVVLGGGGRGLLLGVMLLCCAWVPVGHADNLAEGAQVLDEFLADAGSWQANFQQELLDGEGYVLQEAEGRVWVSRPGKFRWEYAKPDPIVIVSDGRFLWHYDIALKQVVKSLQKDALSQSPAAIMAGEQDYRKHFFIETVEKGGGVLWLRMRPLREDPHGFVLISLGFREEGHGLHAMELQDHFNQKTRLKFSQVQKNTVAPEERFSFTPPPDADLVEQ